MRRAPASRCIHIAIPSGVPATIPPPPYPPVRRDFRAEKSNSKVKDLFLFDYENLWLHYPDNCDGSTSCESTAWPLQPSYPAPPYSCSGYTATFREYRYLVEQPVGRRYGRPMPVSVVVKVSVMNGGNCKGSPTERRGNSVEKFSTPAHAFIRTQGYTYGKYESATE